MKTVVISGARSMFALKLARALVETGARVVTTDSLSSASAGISRASSRYVRTAAPRFDRHQFDQDVARLMEEEKPDLWIPSYEEVFYLARLRESTLPGLPLFAPSLRQLALAHDKSHFAFFAEKLGFAPREIFHLTDTDAVEALAEMAHELIFKPVWSRGGERVLVEPTAQELKTIRPTPEQPWLAQTYLPGDEISTYAIAWHGQLVAHTAYRPHHRAGFGAAIAFEPAEAPETLRFTRAFVEATGWHGQLGFDFRQDDNGKLLPMECNPRATSGIHFLSHADLAAALSGQEIHAKQSGRMPMLGLAMLTYGLPSALGRGRGLELCRDLLHGKDVIWDKKDPAPLFQQLTFLLEVIRISRERKISVQAAFTRDLEWDGESLG